MLSHCSALIHYKWWANSHVLMDYKFIKQLTLSYKLYHTIQAMLVSTGSNYMFHFADFRAQEADSDCIPNNKIVSTWLLLIKVSHVWMFDLRMYSWLAAICWWS